MLKLSSKDFIEIRQWMYRNARHLELVQWQYEFENGRKEAILEAMLFYQNEDGGFGNGFEPDNWNPNSTPYMTMFAIDILKNIGATDVNHLVLSGILRFLDSGTHFTEKGWDWSIPTNDEYPHAPWWNYDPEHSVQEFGLSAEIASFILQVCEKNSSLYNKGITVAKYIIERLKISIECNAEGGNVTGANMLLEALQKLDLLGELNGEFLPEAVKKMISSAIVTDSSKWEEYGGRPLGFIETPNSVYYNEYKDIVQKELDYLIESRSKQGVWGLTWTWFDNIEKYEKAWAISENWWKCLVAIGNLRYLKNFDRLEII